MSEKFPKLNFVNASDWLATEPPEPDQIMLDTFDRGDKLAIFAPSKLRKSFFLLQMSLSLAAGRDFLAWRVFKPRRVIYVQFEIKHLHNQRRLQRMSCGMGLSADELGGRLQILNARGLGINGVQGIRKIEESVKDFAPDIIAFDPFYKLATGIENAAEDVKVILDAFDRLAERTGAAIAYVHHDSKGVPGDRDIRDRGAGSGVLGRDYDCGITLTPHATAPDAAVVEVLLRNYRPQEPFTISWVENDSLGYCFEERPDIAAQKKTSKTRTQSPELSTYLPDAKVILGDGEIPVAVFRESFKKKTGLSDRKVWDFMRWSTAGDAPHIEAREERGHGKHEKYIRIARCPDGR
jgi:hypothetical protein